MGCNHPLNAFWTGFYTETGKKDYFISTSVGDVVSLDIVRKAGKIVTSAVKITEINGKAYLTDPLRIPCGHCVGCRMKRAKQWQIRLVHEAEKFKDRVWFVTLTYDPWHLPVNDQGEPYLSKRHVTLFMKRLRKYSGKPWRYFLCGEYGSVDYTARPHYHAILFGDFDDLIPFKFNAFHSALLTKCWPYGLHEVSPAEKNSMAYVAGYVEKKQNDPCFDSYPVKPFVRMSTKPGIGFDYAGRVDGQDKLVYGNFGNTHYAPIPRAYLKKHEEDAWYEDFKKDQIFGSKITETNNIGIFQTTNKEKMGDMKDAINLEKLEKVRISKI